MRRLSASTALLLLACNESLLVDHSEDEGEARGEPVIAVEPESLDLGAAVAVGSPDDELAVSAILLIRNVGTATLLLKDMDLEDDEGSFTLGAVSSPSIAVDGDIEVQVTFNPLTIGPHEDALRIESNDPVQDVVVVELFGRGVPPS